MKIPFKDKPWYKFLSNKYILTLLLFSVWMLFLDNVSFLNHRILNNQIQELEANKKYYIEEIRKDNEQIKFLNNPDQTEKFAREKYFMKKDSEDIYIIEIESDSTKTDSSKFL